MTTKAIQRRRGSTAQHSTFTGLLGELTVDTDKDTIVVHDGVTVGGHPLPTLDGAETLTNKTISVDDNTVSGIAASSFVLSNGSGNIDGSAAQKAIPSGVVVGTTDTQTLTNKTLGSGTSISADQPAVISVNSSSDALRITQTGSGNALVVEDSTNPDSTPFVVNNSGRVVAGATEAYNGAGGYPVGFSQYAINGESIFARYSNDTNSTVLELAKSRGTSVGSQSIVSNGDGLGILRWSASDGTNLISAAQIFTQVDGTPGTNDMPGRLVFSTTADGASSPTERMRIDSAGRVGIGADSPSVALDVGGVSSTGLSGLSNTTFYTGFRNSNVFGGIAMGAGINGNSPFIAAVKRGSDGAALPLMFYTDGNEQARIDSSGNVGIGTSSPSQKLDVNGDASIYGVRVGRGAGAVLSNTAVGFGALNANTTGSSNTANGRDALYSNTEGGGNVANGRAALYSNTTGNNNTATGRDALYNNTTGNDNTASGLNALYFNTTGSSNTANGRDALLSNTTGDDNTANGYRALYSNTTGSLNTANGLQALFNNTTGGSNTANGVNALYNNTTGINNTATGRNSLGNNTTGGNNTATGRDALLSNTTGSSNTANGANALYSNTEGVNNVANGVNALYNNSEGDNNTATGRDALFNNITGNANVANGYRALYYNTEGGSNTANGYQALYSNTTGISNIANGRDALYSNTTGSNNVANGYQALNNNTTGGNNTANGYRALFFNTTGNNNTANGFQALLSNTTGGNNTATGRTALNNNITGNNNTANGRDALNNNTIGNNNTANGYAALYSNTTGENNTANGFEALFSNTTGNDNTANGYRALYLNTEGIANVANGYEALRDNTEGDNNTATGRAALYSNTTGNDNAANGRSALRSNTTGSSNTATGFQALYSNTAGDFNVANGRNALYSNTTGDFNTANGVNALLNNTTGINNTANGLDALYFNTTGANNVANGRDALRNNTTGSGNFGAAFRTSTNAYAPVFNPTTQDNRIVMGHTAVTNAYVQVAWTVVSDARDKTQIAPVPHGLDFVNQLNPVEFKFRVNRESEETNGNKRYGFLAQEVLEVEGADNVIVDTEDPDKLKMTNEELIPVMVKAMQEMSAEIKALKAEIATLKGN